MEVRALHTHAPTDVEGEQFPRDYPISGLDVLFVGGWFGDTSFGGLVERCGDRKTVRWSIGDCDTPPALTGN